MASNAPMSSAAAKTWEREVDSQARQLEKEQLEQREKERADANKRNREVEKLLTREGPSRAFISNKLLGDDANNARFKNSVSGNILTDGAGVEWRWDSKTRWWWWLRSDGTWQRKGRAWTPLPKTNWASLPTPSEGDVSDIASVSAGSSASTAVPPPPGSFPDKGERRRAARTAKRAAAKVPAMTTAGPQATEVEVQVLSCNDAVPAPEPAPASALAQSERPESPAKGSIEIKGRLVDMVETIRGELGLDDSLNMAEVIKEANFKLGKKAEGGLAMQAKSLLREVTLP